MTIKHRFAATLGALVPLVGLLGSSSRRDCVTSSAGQGSLRERWIVNADGGQTSLPPPNGAQMTRRMALTQSSMSVWELAMSRKDSWLIGARSFSPVPPVVRGEGERRMRWTKDSPGVKRRHKSSPEGHRRLTGSLIN